MNFAKLFETAISDPAKNQNIFRRFQLQKTLKEGVSCPVLYSLLNLTFFFPQFFQLHFKFPKIVLSKACWKFFKF